MINSKLTESFQNPNLRNEGKLNYVVQLSNTIRDCRWFKLYDAKQLFLWRGSDGDLHLSKIVPQEGRPFLFLNKELVFDN